MNQQTQIKLIKAMADAEMDMLHTKGNDYAGEEDVLKNFKQVSQICAILNIDSRNIYGTHLFYIILKIQRICNLLEGQNKAVMNESIKDTISDLRNYAGLLACSIEE